MRFTFAGLWRPSGTVSRSTYAVVGLLGFAVKHNLDRIVATLVSTAPGDYSTTGFPCARLVASQICEAPTLSFWEQCWYFRCPLSGLACP